MTDKQIPTQYMYYYIPTNMMSPNMMPPMMPPNMMPSPMMPPNMIPMIPYQMPTISQQPQSTYDENIQYAHEFISNIDSNKRKYDDDDNINKKLDDVIYNKKIKKNDDNKIYLKDFKKIPATDDGKDTLLIYITTDIEIIYNFVKENHYLFKYFERKKNDIYKTLINIDIDIKSMKKMRMCVFNIKCKNKELCGFIHEYKFLNIINLYKNLQESFNKLVKYNDNSAAYHFTHHLNIFEDHIWNMRCGCEYDKKSTQ
jgi:hypothetical protein